MSSWSDRVAAHQLLSELGALEAVLGEVTPASQVDAAAIARMDRVAAQLGSLVSDADSQLVAPALLTAAVQPVIDMRVRIQAYGESSASGELAEANDSADALIATIGWPMAYAARRPAGLRATADAFQRRSEQLVGELERQVSAGQARQLEVEAKIEEDKQSLDSASTEAIAAVDKAAATVEARLASLSSSIDAQNARVTAALAGYATQFQTAEQGRVQRAEDFFTSELEKNTEVRESAAGAFSESQAALATQAASVLTDLEIYKARANDLVNTIGAIGISGGFGKYANQQRRVADAWALAAAIVLAILAVVGVLVLAESINVHFDVTQVGIRLLVTIPVLALTVLAARQSGVHRRNEIAARRLELELAAIDPYLVLLDAGKRDDAKIQLLTRMFAQPAGDPDHLSDLDKKMFDVMSEFAKRK